MLNIKKTSLSILNNKTNFYLLIMSIILIILSFYNFLLFHTLTEFISIIVSFIIFVLAIYSFDKAQNNFIIILGIAYGFIGFFDLLHTISYRGMGVFVDNTADLPTQLWIIARYLESIFILIALWFVDTKNICDIKKIVNTLLGVSIVTLILLFFNIFPACYIEGEGLTLFKIISEYIISGILIFSMFLLYKKKKHFENYLYNLIIASIVLTIFSEISFTFYIDVFGLSNTVGHIFKLFSVILIFKAIVESGLKKPYDLLYRKLRLQKEKIEEEKTFIEAIYNNIEQGICVHEMIYDEKYEPKDYKVIDTNRAYQNILGISSEKAIGSLATELYKTETPPFISTYNKVVETGEPIVFEEYYQPMEKYFSITVTSPKKNQFITLFNDITEEKKNEEELKSNYDEIKELSNELESIISLTDRFSFAAKYSLKDFLVEVLESSLELVKEADYGSISIFENGNWNVYKNIGYKKEIVKALNKKRDLIFKSDENIFTNDLIKINNNDINLYIDMKNISSELENYLNITSKVIKESIFIDFDINKNKKVRISLDIAAHKDKQFNEKDERLLKAFRNLVYVFIREQPNESEEINENELFEE